MTQPTTIKKKCGFAVIFTGLSGSGKSTLSAALKHRLETRGNFPITLLDGDVIRDCLSPDLGFSKQHRELNSLRLGFISKEIVKHSGVVICAAIFPYDVSRKKIRTMIEEEGHYIEVYLSTPLTVCEERDCKGLYKQARQGKIKHFTGVDDPFETPFTPDITLDTSHQSIDSCLHQLLNLLVTRHCIAE